MAAIASITAFDGASTPVSHTFAAIGITREGDRQVAQWQEVSLAVPSYAQPRIRMTSRRLKSGVFQVEKRTVVPVMENPTGSGNSAGYTAQPKVAYEDTHYEGGLFHERSTSVGRRLVRQLSMNVANAVTTSVAPATTGPWVELFDYIILPT